MKLKIISDGHANNTLICNAETLEPIDHVVQADIRILVGEKVHVTLHVTDVAVEVVSNNYIERMLGFTGHMGE